MFSASGCSNFLEIKKIDYTDLIVWSQKNTINGNRLEILTGWLKKIIPRDCYQLRVHSLVIIMYCLSAPEEDRTMARLLIGHLTSLLAPHWPIRNGAWGRKSFSGKWWDWTMGPTRKYNYCNFKSAFVKHSLSSLKLFRFKKHNNL